MDPLDSGPSRLYALVASLIKDPIRAMINPGIERTGPCREVEALVVLVEKVIVGEAEVEYYCGEGDEKVKI